MPDKGQRWNHRARRFNRRASYRAVAPLDPGGRLRHWVRPPQPLRGGKLLVTVTNRRKPRLTARAIVR